MRVKVRVDEVLEVGQAVLRRHFEQTIRVRRIPIEIRGDVVGRDREGEDATIGVTSGHDLDEGLVDQVHFMLELAVGEIADLVGNQRVFLCQVIRACPVEGEVRERALATPARRNVEVVDQFLHALDDLVVLHVVQADEGRHVGVERGERLGAGPFILQGAKEVHDLATCGREVCGRAGSNRTTHTVEAFLDQALQRPAGAVAGEHVEVVDMVVTPAVRFANFGGVDLFEPVVRNDLAG